MFECFKSKDADRPGKNEVGAKLLWYPDAKIVNKMATKGEYPKGYPEGALVHYTSGRYGMSGMDFGREQGYAFMYIDFDGTVYQGHPLNRWGQHAGDSYWNGLGNYVSNRLVGIEITNASELEKHGDVYKTWFGTTIPESEVRYSKGSKTEPSGYFHKYTQAQEESLIRLLVWLFRNNPTVFNPDLILGHHEVAGPANGKRTTFRKSDPGGALSMGMAGLRDIVKKKGVNS